MPEDPKDLLGWIVGGLDVGRWLLSPLGTIELQNGLQRDFADPVLDRELPVAAILLLVEHCAKVVGSANIRGAVELAIGILDERSDGVLAVSTSALRAEVVKGFQCAQAALYP